MEEVKVTIGMDAGPADRELAGLQNNVRTTEQVVKDFSRKVEMSGDDIEKVIASVVASTKNGSDQAKKKLKVVSNEIGRVSTATKEARETTDQQTSSINDMAGAVSTLPGPVGNAASSFSRLTSAVSRFTKLPVLWFIAAMAAAYQYLTWSMNRTVEGQEKLDVATARMNQRLENLKDLASDIGRRLYDAFEYAAGGAVTLIGKLDSLIERVRALGGGKVGHLFDFSMGIKGTLFRAVAPIVKYLWNRNVDKAEEYATRSNALWREQQKNKKEEALLERQVSESREKMYDRSLSIEEREKAYRDALEANNKLFEKRKELAVEEYAIAKGRNTLSDTDRKALEKETDLEAQIIRLETQHLDSQRMLHRMKNGLDSQSISEDHRAAEKAERRAKEKALALKYSDEMAQLGRDAEDAIVDATIAGIQDKAERERKVRTEQHRRKLRNLRAQEDEVYRAIYEQRKRQWELTHKDDPYELTEQGIKGWRGVKDSALSENEQDFIGLRMSVISSKARQENTEYKRLIEEEQRQRQQQLYDYIREYGSIQLQKETITKEYNEKIARTSDEIQRAALAKEKERLLSELNVKELQQGLDWEAVFGNLDRMATSALKSLKEKLKAALDNNDVLPSDAKVLSEKILEIEEKISERTNVWASLLPPLRERERLIRAAKAAEDEYSRAKDKQIESENKLLGLQSEALTKIKLRTGKEISSEELSSMSSEDFLKVLGLEGLDESNDEVKNAKDLFDKLSVAMTDFKKSTENATEAQDRRSNANALLEGSTNLKEIFKKAVEANGGGAMGTISVVANNLQSLGDLVDRFELGNTDFGQAVHGFADGVAGFQSAIGKIASGDIVGGVVGILDGIAGFGRAGISLFAGQGNVEDMEDEINYLAEVNEGLAKSIDSLSESITQNSNTNQQSIDAYKAAKKAEEEWEANQRRRIDDRASEYSNSGHGFLGLKGKHSFNYYMPGNDWGGWSRFSQILRNNGYNTNVNRGNLWNLSPEEMRLLRDYAPGEWRELLEGSGESNPSDLINEYIDRAGEMERLTSALNEKLTGYSWDGFLDSYKSLLKDLTSETEDFADHINDVISNALIESFVNEELKADIQKLYKYIAKAAENGIDEEEQKTINAMNDAISQKGLTWRDNMEKAGMIKQSDGSSHSGSTGRTSPSLSQETGDEISGRMTVIQVQNDALGRQVAGIVTQMQALTTVQSNSSSYLEEIRNIMITSNSFLDDIARSNKKIYSEFSSQLKSIDSKLG